MGTSKIQLGHQLLIKESLEVINVAGQQLNYILLRSNKRKRSLAMKIRKDGQLQLNVPYCTSQIDVEEFILIKYSWIKSKLNKKPKAKAQLEYSDGELHKYQGQDYSLKLIVANLAKVELVNGSIVIYHRKNASIKNMLKLWYRMQALAFFKQRTELFANSYDLPKINAIKVRYMRARWGSCNTRAEITFNIHLIKAHQECIDYVIIHELCHLIHHNHGKGFYALQTKLNPSWKLQKQKLKKLEF